MPTWLDPEGLSISELVKNAKADYGMTWDEMATEMGRSPRLLRKLANGEIAGEQYRTTLTELYQNGRVETLTPRRRTKSGELSKVRGKKGSPSVTPQDTVGKRVETGRKRDAFRSHPTQFLAGGGKLDRTDMPAGKKSKGREKAWNEVDRKIQRATKSQAHHDRRLGFELTVKDAEGKYRSYRIGSKGGYHASDVRADIRGVHGGSTESWFASQLEAVYPDAGVTIVSVEMNEYNATRTKDLRKKQDAAGTRRGVNKRQWNSMKH